MNHVYRIVWRAAQQTWVVVSELARGKVKSSVNESSGIAAEGCLVDVTAWRRSVLGLAVLAAMPLSAAAQTNFYWNGSADSNIDNAANWTSMSGGTPGYSDDAYINVSGPNPAMLLFGYEYLHANKLYIGDGAGSNGVLKVDFSDPDLFDPGVQVGDGSGGSALTIGGNGGNGLLDVDLDVVEQYRGMYMWGDGVSTLDIGAGTNSTGTVNILGNGKTPALQSMQGGLMTQYFGAVRVGVDQGTGEINIIGGSFDSSDTTQGQLLLVGSGTGSTGRINVLAGGKFSMDSYPYASDGSAKFIVGHDGGSGYLVVDDTPAASNTNGAVTRANLGGGLVLGSGAGSYGGLQVLAGGKSFTYTSCHGSCVVEPVQLGVAGGTGEALVSGTGSIWYVSGDTSPVSGGVLGDPGDLQLGYSGKGVLTINDGGKVTLGQAAIDEIPPDNFSFQIVDFVDSVGDLHIAAQAGSEGVLNIGGAEGGAAQASGILAAAHAIFGAGAGRINFNHLDTAYQFDVVTEGAGKVNNYAGTTWLNGINTYSGETNLYGGALGLSNN